MSSTAGPGLEPKGYVSFADLEKSQNNFRRLVWTGVGIALTLCVGAGAYAAFFSNGQ